MVVNRAKNVQNFSRFLPLEKNKLTKYEIQFVDVHPQEHLRISEFIWTGGILACWDERSILWKVGGNDSVQASTDSWGLRENS